MCANSGPLDDIDLLAPCGLNCSLCRAFVRDRKPCPGCRGGDNNKSNACLTCVIKHCGELSTSGHRFCFSCASYPCINLLHLDNRYRMKYGVSVIANLARIKAIGTESYVAEENAKWLCSKCGSRLSMHKAHCVTCGNSWQVG